MIKRTLYFGNPSYLSLRNAQLVLRLPEVWGVIRSGFLRVGENEAKSVCL